MDGILVSSVNHGWATGYEGNYKVNGRAEAIAQEVLSRKLAI